MEGPQGAETPTARSDYDDEEKTVTSSEKGSALREDGESAEDKEVLAAPPTIELNQYSEQDIETLTKKIKRCTTLFDLEEEDWTDEVYTVIREYFELPGTEVLSIYFNDLKLEATLTIPMSPIRDLTYFIKDADKIVSVENFHDIVMFGTLDTTVEGSLLAVLENVYAPVFFNATSWPDSVKSDFCSQMHSFLGNLTDLRHKMLAVTVIYVPKEGLNVDVDEAQHDKELIKRLEGVVVHWMKQIRVALGDKDQSTINELLCPKDEFSFWAYRYENLRGLQHQLENKDLKHICNILNASQSAYISNFYQLQDEIKEALFEAKSNVEYLHLLMEPCNQLEDVQSVSEIPERIPDILSLFRVIWNNSPYYNTTSRLTVICRALSNQIILQCGSTVDLDDILHGGHTHSGIKTLNNCITCCEQYKMLYDKIAGAHLRLKKMSWDLDRPTIFNHVDSFVQRCRDMIDVCEAMIVFGRVDETEEIAKPQFFGTRGPEFERICDKIEQNFFSALQDIKDVQHTILDVQASTWYDSIFRFRKRVRDIEIIVDNLVAAAFENVRNVEEGIDVLWATYQYAKRPNLKDLFEKKTYQVYDSFSNALLKMKTMLVSEKEKHPVVMASYSGRAMMALMKKRELLKIIDRLNDAEWMLLSGKGEEVRSQYKKISVSVDEYVKDLHRRWLVALDDDVSKLLNRKLLVPSTSRPGLLEPNFDRRIQSIVQEAWYWTDMSMSVPTSVQHLANRWKSLSFLYESVLTVALDYNRIISSLSDEERLLFRELIKGCDKKINPGLQRYTWDTDIADIYIVECLSFTSMVQDVIDDYKSSVQEIVLLCEQICDSPLVKIPPTSAYELANLDKLMYEYRKEVTIKIVQYYKDIIDYLWFVSDKFEDHMNNMMDHWARFVSKMDLLVEEALRLCFKNSLQVMYEVLHGDGTTGPSPLIVLRTDLLNNQITFEPTLLEVGTMVSRVLRSFLDSLKGVPRLWERFNTKVVHPSFYQVIENDEECKKLQASLNQEMTTTVEQLKEHLTRWEPFRDMWEVNKDQFIASYEKMNAPISEFDLAIAKYSATAENVQLLETTSQVHFLLINSSALKQAISEHCTMFSTLVSTLLRKLANEKITNIYKYTSENGSKINEEPKNLKDLQESLALYDRLVSEVPVKEKEFPIIRGQMAVLRNYDVEIPQDMQELEQGLDQRWQWYLDLLKSGEEMLATSKDVFQKGLLKDADDLKYRIHELYLDFVDNGPYTSKWKALDALAYIKNTKGMLETLKKDEAQIRADLAIFHITYPDSVDLDKLNKDLLALEVIWIITDRWDKAWDSYKHAMFLEMQSDEMDGTAQMLLRQLLVVQRELKDIEWEIISHTRNRIETFRKTLPLLTDLKNPAMRQRHWNRIKMATGRDFDQESADFTLEKIIDMEMQTFSETINIISYAATMELNIEEQLKKISQIWKETNLEMHAHMRMKGVYSLKAVDNVFQALEEHQVGLSSMKSSKYVEPFVEKVDFWEKALSLILEVLETTLTVQRQWLYLENIFTGEDIRKQLPTETEDFNQLSELWMEITGLMHSDTNAKKATHHPGLLDKLNQINSKFEYIQRALEKYLETKRHIFPRFYFISNEDLLEILANSRKPDLIQPHLKKLFCAINKLKIGRVNQRWDCFGMFSLDGEFIPFSSPVALDGSVEIWLCAVEEEMFRTLREELKQCRNALRKNLTKRDKWIKEWPGQLCITSSQIQWTSSCTRTLTHCKILESKKPLKKLRKKMDQVLSKFSEAIRGNLTKIQRLKIVGMVTIEIHARDVIDQMYKAGCQDVQAFDWLKQLRFYWDKERDDCVVRQTNTFFVYGYEYLGNSERLVITPLTDRCYITLTTALHLHRGGSPKGPAGTGKTETVKDLGKGLGLYVIVINCSEGLDYKSIGKMFSGLSQTGAWGCFDEFNRINIEVLSVVAQQILSMLTALAGKNKRFVFEGSEISMVESCGIFITMNPGYAGRTELPDNLKSMFRPIAMMVPDSAMIAEIMLFAEGFRDTRVLAKKVYTLFSLSKQQLSKQDHYEWGLRGLVTLIRYAGKKRRTNAHLPDEEVLLLSMKDMNLAKLSKDDVPLFLGILNDLFPAVDTPQIDYNEFTQEVKAELEDKKLQVTEIAVRKVIQLFETKNSRHSAMLVGKTGAAKSTTWKVLKGALTRLNLSGKANYNKIEEFPINPKALNLAELYGEFNLATSEWMDGVISNIMRSSCASATADEKWVLFDGPVDAVWIENMNSVMDDNKVLTLVNSERITMPDQVSLLFEVEDLAEASPATVSRCGIVYNDYKDFGWKPYVDSWLESQNKDFASQMKEYFEHYVNPVLEFKKLHCIEPIPVAEISAISTLCNLLTILATAENGVDPNDEENFAPMSKFWFLFCLVWSICAGVDESGRKKLDNFVREMEGVFPLKDSIYEYYVDVRARSLANWEDKLSDSWKFNSFLPFFKIIVPTVDTIRYEFVISHLLRAGYRPLLVGPVGTGKTSTASTALEGMDNQKMSMLVINMSAQTTSKNVQDMIESRLEKRTKGVYVPSGGKSMLTFMDDLNMPAKEVYGAQPPLELIRQWIDYGFWYDRMKQVRTYVKDIFLMAAMGPPGGGRNTISNRLLSRFSIINMTFPSESAVIRIFGTMLNQHLTDFDEQLKQIAPNITQATVDLYHSVTRKMLPTPAKMHYLFNLRDISKVFQGLLRSHKDYQNTKTALLRLWIHECFRVFSDRLIDAQDQEWFSDQINEILGRHFEITFHSVCPSKKCPVFGEFCSTKNIYEDLNNMAELRKFLNDLLDDYNMKPGIVPLDLVLFQDAIEHVTRIARVLTQPRGNMLLVGVGGSGRQSLSKIATLLCKLTVFRIEVTKYYRLQEFKEDMKMLYSMAGVEDKPTCFLFTDTQVTDERFVEVINNILSSGEVPNLYKADEFEEIKKRLEDTIRREKISPSTESIYNFLIDRVRANLHVVLCLSPVGEAFRNRLRQYPALINCTTIDWFVEWPQEALLEVADKYLKGVDLLVSITGAPIERVVETMKDTLFENPQDKMRAALSSIFSTVHSSVSNYSKKMLLEMKRCNYVTPTNYLELVSGYKTMLKEKREELSNSANKLRNGLSKIDETREKVQVMTVELEVAQAQVMESQKLCEDYLKIISKQQTEADLQQKEVAIKKLKIGEEEVVCKRLAAVAQADLDEAMPALEEAMRALDALNKKDLTEIKSYPKPPYKVEMVMEAVMILKKVEPTWAEAKRQLGDVEFLNKLRDFDKDHISDRVLKKVGTYTSREEFEPESVGSVSTAAKSLCMWVRAIEKYAKVYRIVAPKIEKRDSALASLREKQAMLAAAEAKLQELAETLERLQIEYEEKLKQSEELREKASLLEMKLARAKDLVDGLADERDRWTNTVTTLDYQFDLLPGDVLIAIASVAYLGPFVTVYREELTDIWKKSMLDENVPMSPDWTLVGFLTDKTTVREWNLQGLPTDLFSTENGVIITRANRWPLIIDPQCQAWRWIKNLEGSNGLHVLDSGQPNFLQEIEKAIEMGEPVLLQNVLESLDPAIEPILSKALIQNGNELQLRMGDHWVHYHPSFKLFMTTKLPNPHYAPEVSTKTTIVNCAIKEEGLEAQLLGIVVRKEKPELEEQKDQLMLTISEGNKTLKSLEDELLRLLNESEGPLLDNEELFRTLKISKLTSTSVKESLEISRATEVEIDQAREAYRLCAQRASILFFVLNDLSRIDPMYQFSLESYIQLFTLSTEKSPKSSLRDDRIVYLNDYHTHAFFKNTCRALFEKHKLLFAFYMCVKILEAQMKMSLVEYNYFLKGGVVLDRATQPDNPCVWLDPVCWDNVTELDKLPGFHGLVTSFEQFNRDWHSWYTIQDPENNALIGEWQEQCTEFQRILIVRALRPDRVTFCVSSFIVNTLGPKFVDPPVLDIRAVFEDSRPQAPLIFVLSPGVDPTAALLQLAESTEMMNHFQSLSLGQGQAPIATKLMEKGIRDGDWVFLANCHLSLSWMPSLDKMIENLQSQNVHPRFRLWLSSSPTPDFPIPILQAGLKMTTEPPKGLRANLKRLYHAMTDASFTACTNAVKYKKLLFALCFFHSILIERKKFQQLGWNIIYSFNDSDFEVSGNLLTLYLDEYEETPWDALKYLIAGVCYGGHVTDDWDRRLLHTYISQFFSDDTLDVAYFRLSSLSAYYVPRDGSLASYRDYITLLPAVDLPQAFGQHPNADITALISETRILTETLSSIQSSASSGKEGEKKEDRVSQLAADVLVRIPEPIDYMRTENLIGASKTPLDVILLQEITRYNSLLVVIIDSLRELQKAIRGEVVMSSQLEEILDCIYEGRVPSSWLRAYSSMMPLGSWTRDLILRVEHFSHWAETTHPPVLFWLAAFTFPTGFLTAVLQTSARSLTVSIDTLCWEFTVLQMEENIIVAGPHEGVYIRSMFLEGAGWDRKTSSLVEPSPMQLIVNMPVVHFKPVETSKKKTRGLYSCPCYYIPQRCGTQGKEAYIVTVDLKSGAETADHWIKRATALLLSLSI
ncbi:dynein heavy chain 2, axonemal [Thrips palmi]|uniref:Dynein axonemal heavy chain 2 n=1 Tax=Thrips palmi TaxID=161013 RepID=A0A6P8ZH16_THRPL|nr:dynein heavy chain 2, axonemal [Thrips palmi]